MPHIHLDLAIIVALKIFSLVPGRGVWQYLGFGMGKWEVLPVPIVPVDAWIIMRGLQIINPCRGRVASITFLSALVPTDLIDPA